jgi:hypothetical protein
LSNRKAREALGFREAHDWRKYVEAADDGGDALTAPSTIESGP